MCSQALLAQDANFRSRVYVAMVAAAVAVAGEAVGAMTAAVYGKRQTLATAVLSNPLAYLERFAVGAASNSTIGGDVVAPVGITSSTAACPTVVTTSAAHGFATGDTVEVAGSVGNTAANGQWPVTVLSATTFSAPVAGNAAGTAGGSVTKQPPDADITNFGPFSQWNKFAGVTALD
jgi:hypothetical protein